MARALARATAAGDDAAVELLQRGVGDPDLDAGGVAELTDLLVRTGAVADVERIIEELWSETLTQIEARDWPEPARGTLVELAHAAVRRTA